MAQSLNSSNLPMKLVNYPNASRDYHTRGGIVEYASMRLDYFTENKKGAEMSDMIQDVYNASVRLDDIQI